MTGTIADEHLDTVTVNGNSAKVDNGQYSARVMLDEGDNEIKVVAKDKEGNTSEEIVNVDVKFSPCNLGFEAGRGCDPQER